MSKKSKTLRSVLDITTICRICLQSNEETYDIYTSYDLKRNTLYSEMLASCTKIKPTINDHLPHLICKVCCRHLKRTYTFNLQCEKSDMELRSYLLHGFVSIPEPFQEIKQERNYSKTHMTSVGQEDNFNDIKTESNELDNDHFWDADDDNLVLGDIKAKRDLEEATVKDENKNDGDLKSHEKTLNKAPDIGSHDTSDCLSDQIKGKRGRKKKVVCNGETVKRPISKMPHQCDVCGKILSTKSNLKAHKICHTDIRPYKCTECPATFRGHSALFQHRKVHTKETPYHCEYCPKQFSRRTGLVNHVRAHTGEKLYSCEICLKNFVQSAQLSIHMKRHLGDKPFLCQECGKGFPIKSDLRVHQRIHNGEKPYNCHLCAKTFATSGNLAIHIRIHNKEVRYNCQICERGFVTCSAYNVHLKRHKGQKDYHCECGKTFYTSSALKQHRVVHTGEKKYQCKICERKFTQTSHLTRHFKRDHWKPNVPAPSSDQYKTVVKETKLFGAFEPEQHASNNSADVKPEGP